MQKDGFNGALKKLESPDNSTLYKNDTYHNETHEEKLAHLKPIRLLQQKLYAEQKGYDPKNQTKKQNSSRLYQDRKRHWKRLSPASLDIRSIKLRTGIFARYARKNTRDEPFDKAQDRRGEEIFAN